MSGRSLAVLTRLVGLGCSSRNPSCPDLLSCPAFLSALLLRFATVATCARADLAAQPVRALAAPPK